MKWGRMLTRRLCFAFALLVAFGCCGREPRGLYRCEYVETIPAHFIWVTGGGGGLVAVPISEMYRYRFVGSYDGSEQYVVETLDRDEYRPGAEYRWARGGCGTAKWVRANA